MSAGCQTTKPVKVFTDGLEIQLTNYSHTGIKAIKLTVISPEIIRVSAIGDKAHFSSSRSLMRDTASIKAPAWEHETNGEYEVIRTRSVSATVSRITGEVIFKDSTGNTLLREPKGGEKKLIPVTIDNESFFQISQSFDSPDDEAIYGLGQQQTGIMNYKNKDVDLTQYNAIVAVPFLISSRHYGLLWDNYSISHFGDNREKKPLSAFTLKGKDGSAPGLTATYSNRNDSSRIYVRRQESQIDYSFLPSLKDIPSAFPMPGGKVTWEGSITSDTSGTHKFYLTGSGYIKFWLDDVLLLDKWREGWNPGPSFFELPMKKDRPYSIKLEWIPESDQAFASLKWLPPVPEEMQHKTRLSSEAGKQLDYYFIFGKNADKIIEGYRLLTGKAAILPKWAYGFWQSRERYKTQAEIEQTVGEFRKRKIGLDNIVLDWSYWKEDQWGSQEFDSIRFPDPEGMIQKLHETYNTHFMISVWPKFYEGIDNYKLFADHNWLYQQNIVDKTRDWIGKGYTSTFYDAFNPDARKAFWGLLNTHLYSKGVDAWWLDATEPDILSNATIEKRKALMNPTASGPSTAYFNGYALAHAKGIYEGQRITDPGKRVFILTRSAYAGLQRYGAATWSGDIAARFDELERQIPAGINFSMSGLPYWTTDIGGFFVEDKYDKPDPRGEALEEWRELNTRWYQFGAFCPIFRSHGQYPYRELFNIAPETHPAYQSMLYYNRLRYQLLPYIYSLAGSVYHHDYTMMRGLIMDFPEDQEVRPIKDQYMFGPSLLINPVYQFKARSRQVYLPGGQGWYDFHTGSFYEGGRFITATASYTRMPVFVKEGSILPVGPVLQYTAEKSSDMVTLYVYTGKDASFTLYEDEGTNYNYEKGQFSTIPVSYNESAKTLTIGKRKGTFSGLPENKIFRVVWIKPGRDRIVQDTDQSDTAISYNGNEQTIRMNIKD
ncbi:MAG: DUF5110 domain-containing protein [Chitinophagaceae bacterium]|nr:DUF5110 domain-containing protein [Chitinophagaceae bacterium]